MQSSSKESVDDALDSIRDLVKSSRARSIRRKRKSPRQTVASIGGYLVAAITAVILPFVLLIGVATFLYTDGDLHHWVAISGGMVASGLLLYVYARFVAHRIGMGRFVRGSASRFAAILVLAYCGYGLLYLSATNAKTDQVAESYTRLHPIIRLSISTWVLIDRDAVLTDTEREASDYDAMGLPRLERSLHYRQSDGYAHAVDLRTIGRTELRNRVMAFYFDLLGFRTLRHVGTADHLHVSLPMPQS